MCFFRNRCNTFLSFNGPQLYNSEASKHHLGGFDPFACHSKYAASKREQEGSNSSVKLIMEFKA